MMHLEIEKGFKDINISQHTSSFMVYTVVELGLLVSPPETLGTARIKIPNFYMVTTLRLCVLRTLPYAALTVCYLQPR